MIVSVCSSSITTSRNFSLNLFNNCQRYFYFFIFVSQLSAIIKVKNRRKGKAYAGSCISSMQSHVCISCTSIMHDFVTKDSKLFEIPFVNCAICFCQKLNYGVKIVANLKNQS